MTTAEINENLSKITTFLEAWYPPSIAPHVVKTQLKIVGAREDDVTEKDLKMLLKRIEMVVLPTFMSTEDARREIIVLKKNLGISY